MRLGYRVAYRLLQLWTFLRRPEVSGTMVAVLDGDRVLLVRHTYGDRRRWELPDPPVATMPITAIVPGALVDGPAPELEDELHDLHRRAAGRGADPAE